MSEEKETYAPQEETEVQENVIEEIAYISGEYLSAACSMIAWQFIDAEISEDPHPKDRAEFADRVERMLRQHTPLAYSYFFQNHYGEHVIPTGTQDIILREIRRKVPTFLGGEPPGVEIILPK